jgi:N-acetylglucosaminyl-diphospho-decaprenol L-rhamnosyltransferase
MKLERPLSEKISIVIISRNRAQSLESSLKKLTLLRDPVPIIVVDNNSEDNTVQLVQKEYPDVELIHLPDNYGSVGRNIGVEHAKTPYVAFTDDDSWWEDGALKTAIAYFEHYPELGLIQGKIILHGKKIEPACQIMAASPITTPGDFPGKYILGFVACGAIVRKDAFLFAGGFHSHRGVGGEEELLALDMAEQGWTLAYLQDIIAFHAPSPIRNTMRRRQLVIRNHLWSVWLRRSWSSIIFETAPLLTKSITDQYIRQSLIEAFAGLPWVIKERKPVSSALEHEVLKLSRFHP